MSWDGIINVSINMIMKWKKKTWGMDELMVGRSENLRGIWFNWFDICFELYVFNMKNEETNLKRVETSYWLKLNLKLVFKGEGKFSLKCMI